jgi:hypothetical protein
MRENHLAELAAATICYGAARVSKRSRNFTYGANDAECTIAKGEFFVGGTA